MRLWRRWSERITSRRERVRPPYFTGWPLTASQTAILADQEREHEARAAELEHFAANYDSEAAGRRAKHYSDRATDFGIVAMAAILRTHLEALYARKGGDGYVFAVTERPFSRSWVSLRAKAAWKAANLEGLTLHECRHTFASFMIAAGVNAKALSTYMGHANIAVTMDRYGHLMPGNEAEAAELLDAFLAPAGIEAVATVEGRAEEAASPGSAPAG